MINDVPTSAWGHELENLFLRAGACFARVEPRRRMRDYVRGLLGPVGRKNGWQLAEYAGPCHPGRAAAPPVSQSLGRRPPPRRPAVLCGRTTRFIRRRVDHRRHRLHQEGHHLSRGATAILGTAGRTENCQIGVFAAYATNRGHALVDRELYLPKSWTEDRERCRAAQVPDQRGFATKNDLARSMILRAMRSPLVFSWVTADSAYGQDSRFRRFLEDAGLSYVMAVPKSQQVHGPRIDYLIGHAPPEAWQRLSCGDGAKGPRLYDWAAARLPAVWEFDGDEPTRQRWMLARRSITRPEEIAYYLASAPLDATVADLARIAGCRWKIEECFQSAKNECGLDQYEVRRYVGWYRHITLVMLAHTFLAAMAVQAHEKGVTRPTHPTSWTSPRPKSAVCWQLNPTAVLHNAITQ